MCLANSTHFITQLPGLLKSDWVPPTIPQATSFNMWANTISIIISCLWLPKYTILTVTACHLGNMLQGRDIPATRSLETSCLLDVRSTYHCHTEIGCQCTTRALSEYDHTLKCFEGIQPGGPGPKHSRHIQSEGQGTPGPPDRMCRYRRHVMLHFDLVAGLSSPPEHCQQFLRLASRSVPSKPVSSFLSPSHHPHS